MKKTCPLCYWSIEPIPHDIYDGVYQDQAVENGAHNICTRALGCLAGRGYIVLVPFGFQVVKATKTNVAIAKALADVRVADPKKWIQHKLGKRAANKLIQVTKTSTHSWQVWRLR